jgi:acetolactate synthase-1/3 small subunit
MHDTKIKLSDEIERHTLTVLVDNEAGVLARVVGLFSGRGYNIESLTVAEVDPMARTSRITIVTSGTPAVIEQIETQLRRLVPTHKVTNWTETRNGQKAGIEREMALIKVAGIGEKRVEALRMADAFRARPVDTTQSSFVFEITGAPSKIDSFVDLMRPLGLVEVSRTGVAAISRGPDAM